MLLGIVISKGDNLDDPSNYQLMKCPICETPIEGNEEELTQHIKRCLKKVFKTDTYVVNSYNERRLKLAVIYLL